MVARLAHQPRDRPGKDGDRLLADPALRGALAHGTGQGVSRAAAERTGEALKLDGVSKTFGAVNVVKSVSLAVPSGQILALLGPSGCGKTTILRMIAGFLRPTSGSIRIEGEEVNDVPPHRRRLGMVFQNYSLFPHMTVADNVAFGLKMQGVSAAASRAAVEQSLAMVRMSGMERRYPIELSGGQQQRIALARAVVTRPRLLLLDEPFGALDRKLREELQIEVKQLQRELGITFVFVTHDQEEALTISDCIAVMREGEIAQFGSPSEVFERPTSLFVAEFFGSLNTLPVRVTGRETARTIVSWSDRQFAVSASAAGDPAVGSDALLAIRSDDVRLTPTTPAGNRASVAGVVQDVIYKGTSLLCRVRLPDGTLFVAATERGTVAEPGQSIQLSWPDDKAFLFPRPHSGPVQSSSM